MNDERVRDRQEAVAQARASINRDAPRTRLIAGVSVPDGPLITAAIEYAQRLSEMYLFNHAMRSWLFAETIGRTKGIDYDHEVVAIGTILHDIGLTGGVFARDTQRQVLQSFEVHHRLKSPHPSTTRSRGHDRCGSATRSQGRCF